MKLIDAQNLANELMNEHLPDLPWSFDWMRGKRTMGMCHYQKRKIFLSRDFVPILSEDEVRDTILHEIAHVLAPTDGHGYKWKAACRKIGARPERCADVEGPKGKYELKCPNCGRIKYAHRKLKHIKACGECCRKLNYGRYSKKFEFEVKQLY